MLSRQLKAAILSDFAYKMKKRFNSDLIVGFRGDEFVEIYRPGIHGKYVETGFYIHELFEFCQEKFNTYPCLACFDDRISFYL